MTFEGFLVITIGIGLIIAQVIMFWCKKNTYLTYKEQKAWCKK